MSDRTPPSDDDPTEGRERDRSSDGPDSTRTADDRESARAADEPESTRTTAERSAVDRDRSVEGAGRTADATTRDADPPDEPTGSTTIDRRYRSYLSAIVSLFGLWIAISPFVYQELGTAGRWNNVLVGAAIFLGAGYNVYRQYNHIPTNVGAATLVALLGIWLVIAAVVLEMADGAFWSTLVSGAIITILAGANAYAGRTARPVGTVREDTEGTGGR